MKSNIQHPTYNTPIIAMTAHAMAGDEEKSMQAGMNGHVTKPIDPDQLFATLLKWIQPVEKRTSIRIPDECAQSVKFDKTLPDEEQLPECLPGFDLEAGLTRLQGNRRLYRKLLLDFGANYTETAGEIRKALNANDFDQAYSLVHNIKGLAGNLAATGLQVAAVEMEKLVKGKPEQAPSDQELKQKYADLENALNRALESVQIMHSPAAAGEENAHLSPQAIVAKTPEISKDDAGRILTAAGKGDIEELTAIANELKERSDAYTPFSEKLVELAEDFDFEVIGELVSGTAQSASTQSCF
jgi:HPt (histidine-containing phosphotransfer) domain-containing protein